MQFIEDGIVIALDLQHKILFKPINLLVLLFYSMASRQLLENQKVKPAASDFSTFSVHKVKDFIESQRAQIDVV